MVFLNLAFLSLLHLLKPEIAEIAEVHDFHVGITEVRYSPGSETYQVTIQLFTHDLEAAILHTSRDTLRLGTRYETADADTVVFDYVKDRFSLKANGKILNLKQIGRETLSDDETYLYLESEKMPMQDAMQVKNTLIMEIYPEQTHIINIVQGGETHSSTLSVKKSTDIIAL